MHDIDLKDHKQEFNVPFEPLLPVEAATHMPPEVNEVFINHLTLKNSHVTLMMHYMTSSLGQTNGYMLNCHLRMMSPACRHSTIRTKFNVPEWKLTLEKVTKLQKNDTFCKSIIQLIDCSKHKT